MGAIRAVILYASPCFFCFFLHSPPFPPPPLTLSPPPLFSSLLLFLTHPDYSDGLETQSGAPLNKVLLFPFNASFGFNPVMKSTGEEGGGVGGRERGRGGGREVGGTTRNKTKASLEPHSTASCWCECVRREGRILLLFLRLLLLLLDDRGNKEATKGEMGGRGRKRRGD